MASVNAVMAVPEEHGIVTEVQATASKIFEAQWCREVPYYCSSISGDEIFNDLICLTNWFKPTNLRIRWAAKL